MGSITERAKKWHATSSHWKSTSSLGRWVEPIAPISLERASIRTGEPSGTAHGQVRAETPSGSPCKMVTDLLTWQNICGIIVALGFVCWLADKLGWWK